MALKEHASNNKNGRYDEALSTFFRNVDSRFDPPPNLPVGDGSGPIRCLKARAVLVDMEEGVVNEMLKSPLGEVFDDRQLLTGDLLVPRYLFQPWLPSHLLPLSTSCLTGFTHGNLNGMLT